MGVKGLADTSAGITRFARLFAPGTIGGQSLANRAIVAPLTRTSATVDGLATPLMADYYAEYARGGWGAIVSEGTYIDLAHSQGYNNQPGIATEAQVEAWKPVVERVHREGVPIYMQLMHTGSVNQGNPWTRETIAPAAVQPRGTQADRYGGAGPYAMPREMTRDEIKRAIDDFAAAARRALEAGFDGVEVHGANGYLPDQFLCAHTNLRTDEYGGPIESRVRFHVEVLQAVRAAVPAGKVAGVRISESKSNDPTYTWPGGVQDAACVFRHVAKTGVDYIHVSAALGLAPVHGSGQSLAGLAKSFSGLTIFGNGKLHDPTFAETTLTKGECDFVTVGKGAIADPAWPRKIAAGETPTPFDIGMISPLATLENTLAWRRNKAAQG